MGSKFKFKRRGRPTKIEIPKCFECLGHIIRVSLVSQEELQKMAQKHGLASPEEVLEGLYVYSTKEIYLDRSLSPDILEQTYLHERNHCMLYLMGENELAENDSFCELMAQILYQILKTQQGHQLTLPYRKGINNGEKELDERSSKASWKFHARSAKCR